MQTGMIKVEGLHSNQDADKVLNALNEVWGVQNAEVNLKRVRRSLAMMKGLPLNRILKRPLLIPVLELQNRFYGF